jgi:hypothetical protein
MSKRFVRFAEDWVADNVQPPKNPDLEDFRGRRDRIAREILDLAAKSGFAQTEIDEDAAKVPPLVEAAMQPKDFDLEGFRPSDD